MLKHEIARTMIKHAVVIEELKFQKRTLKSRCDGLLENHQDAIVENLEDVFEAIDAQIELYQSRIDELGNDLSRTF